MMSFVIKYIHCVWLAVLLGIVTTSCTPDSADTVPANEEKMLSIGFNVPTRNVYPYPTESGVKRENYIDWTEGNYKIYFFDGTEGNSILIAQFIPDENGITVSSRSEENYIKYEAVGKIPKDLIKSYKQLSSFKIVVLANWLKYPEVTPGTTTIDDICESNDAIFNCFDNFDLSDKKIPFYGVQEYDERPITEKTTILEKPVYLLRAMAKVEVILDSSIPDSDPDKWADLTLSEVKIHRYNSKGYCTPSGVYDGSSYPDDQEHPELHLVENAQNNGSLSFYKESENKWVAYLPEYSNPGQDDCSYITLKFNYQLAGDESYKIYFAQYQEGGNTPSKSDIDLIRNNIYRFTVRKDGFKLFLTVSDWAGLYENVFDFGNGQVVSPVAPWEDKINNEVEIEVN